MFIQNPVWKSVPAYLLEAPVWEGTVLTENGEIVWDSSTGGGSDSATQIQSVGPANMLRSSAPAQEPYGIVPETIYVLPPTMLINVAVGGTIDLTLPGNEAMENFTEDLADELGADFNFVRHNEHTGGSGGSGPLFVKCVGEVQSVSSEGSTFNFCALNKTKSEIDACFSADSPREVVVICPDMTVFTKGIEPAVSYDTMSFCHIQTYDGGYRSGLGNILQGDRQYSPNIVLYQDGNYVLSVSTDK